MADVLDTSELSDAELLREFDRAEVESLAADALLEEIRRRDLDL